MAGKEMLRIFTEQFEPIGVMDRNEVHKRGAWHETFHCWFAGKEEGDIYIWLQLRSSRKKDFPDLLDITAAGHLNADETAEDGVREIEEELGIRLQADGLIYAGTIPDRMELPGFIDREFCHLYLYLINGTPPFRLDEEEVSGMFKASLGDLQKLFLGKSEVITVKGFLVRHGAAEPEMRSVSVHSFVPHERSYIDSVFQVLMSSMN